MLSLSLTQTYTQKSKTNDNQLQETLLYNVDRKISCFHAKSQYIKSQMVAVIISLISWRSINVRCRRRIDNAKQITKQNIKSKKE